MLSIILSLDDDPSCDEMLLVTVVLLCKSLLLSIKKNVTLLCGDNVFT